MRSRLNDITVVSISFLYFLINVYSGFRFNDLLYHLNDIVSRLNELFVVLISVLIFLFQFFFLINIGKEMSLPGFRTSAISIFFLHKQESINIYSKELFK